MQGKDRAGGREGGKTNKGGVIQSWPQPHKEESSGTQDILWRLCGLFALGTTIGVEIRVSNLSVSNSYLLSLPSALHGALSPSVCVRGTQPLWAASRTVRASGILFGSHWGTGAGALAHGGCSSGLGWPREARQEAGLGGGDATVAAPGARGWGAGVGQASLGTHTSWQWRGAFMLMGKGTSSKQLYCYLLRKLGCFI